jgi:hypothetical protein
MGSLRDLAGRALRVAAREAPKLLQRSGSGGRSPAPDPSWPPQPPPVVHPGPPAGRHLAYAPDLDGRADPGEIVWTWVPYEEDATQGKDRPVLVVGRRGATLLGLMLSSQDYHARDDRWFALGSGAWDGEHRQSWVRLDRVLEVREDGIRREGAVLDRRRFDEVADRLRGDYGWS